MRLPEIGETHVWALDLDVGTALLARLEPLLSSDELERAWRCQFAEDRARFVAARAMLRQILASYLNREPRSIQFTHSAFGKPSLATAMGPMRLRFNASASGSLALVALRLDAELGIDVERTRPMRDAAAFASRLLTDAEQAELARLPDEQREHRLLEYWVRKEAIAKSLGRGLHQPFDAIDLSPWPDESTRCVDVSDEGQTTAQWVAPIPLSRGNYVAALASSQPLDSIQCRNWNPETDRLTRATAP